MTLPEAPPGGQASGVTTARATRLVVGCGYLGERVARGWRGAGDRVLAVTRRSERALELAAAGLEPVLADVTTADPAWIERLPVADTVFWAVGFDRRTSATPHDVHCGGFGRLLAGLAGQPRIIFSSSTGVWGDEQGLVVDEDTPTRPDRDAGRVLVEAEALLRSHRLGPGTALRFAGLYGPGRLPRLDALKCGTPIAADPDSWLNLVHVDDAALVVRAIADAVTPGPLYVVSDGRPVRRREWYARLAEAAQAPPPAWDPTAARTRGADKRVDPSRLFRELDIEFAHPDAIAALAGCLPSRPGPAASG